MLCSSSSSIHSPGTRASRAAAKRAVSSGALPRATAAATRTNAAVGASSTGPVPAVIVPLPAPRSLIVSLLHSAFYTPAPPPSPPPPFFFCVGGAAGGGLGAGLGDHAAGVRPHDLGARATLTGDQFGLAQRGFDNAECEMRSAQCIGG